VPSLPPKAAKKAALSSTAIVLLSRTKEVEQTNEHTTPD
jgi:hypothetical protein